MEDKSLINLLDGDVSIVGELRLYDEVPNNEDCVMIELNVISNEYTVTNYNYFEALQELRLILEQENLQILCNGAAINVFPSPMMLGMGTGRTAYKLKMGQKAKIEDTVDIFETDDSLEFGSVSKQKEYYFEWIHTPKK
ncbi:hypothetical protein FACS1894192_09370 [Bacilli bacterium]|nr:hypothetical protein FACS1894192_09370 [Bacilli bacterium]